MPGDLKRAPFTAAETITFRGHVYSVPVLRALGRAGMITQEGRDALAAWHARQMRHSENLKA